MLFAAALCAILTLPAVWADKEFISSDGLSYLEVAVKTSRHGLGPLLTNAYWSPAYPALLALLMKLVHPSLASELYVIHALDWVICAAAYFCFTWFLFNLLKWIDLAHGSVFQSGPRYFGILAFAYTLLLVSNIDRSLWLVGPNIMIEGVVYLIAGVCIRLALPGSQLRHYILLGAVLALGYATKAVLFPLSFILLGLLFIWPAAGYSGRKGVAAAAVVFLVLTSPLVAVLSHTKGRLTFGEAGNLTYAFYVDEIPRYWEVSVPAPSALVHRPKQISTAPPVLKFDNSFDSAYPYWYDPSYWYQGLRSHLDIRLQVIQFLRVVGLAPKFMLSGSNVFQLAKRWIPILAGTVALIFLGFRFRRAWRVFTPTHTWLLLLLPAAFFLFSCVLIEYRYLVPFVVMGWIILFTAAAVIMESGKWLGVTLTVTAGLLFAYVPDLAREVAETHRQPPALRNAGLADRLKSLGIRPGDELVSIGWAVDTYYARLAEAHITMEVVTRDPVGLAKLPAPDVQRTLDALRANGAKAIISAWRPAFENDSGWVPMGQFDFIRLL